MSGIEPDLRPSQGRVLHPLHFTDIISGAGEIRTHRHLFLRQAAQPLAYHTEIERGATEIRTRCQRVLQTHPAPSGFSATLE